ncbi:hypothetical protein [Montanilutibacter psychrotolerans]|uniref:Uncharacterized protein n=1 Tax=Montanilutibacter psychrotolerans TaxID=1327343 RepID=A0A3M8T373_9GAMM|nr:hypothetical protein [Lysobacter psychrotolerans]RNF86186.1 hypothetical protein EER27_01810 [Lysobacter psychrotolerans]
MADSTTAFENGEAGDANRVRKAAVREAVQRYLLRHPQASDTSAGIGAWWLVEAGVEAAPALVEQVLEAMVREGQIGRIRLADDTVIYTRRPASDQIQG